MYYYSKNDDLGNFKAEKYKTEIEGYIINTTPMQYLVTRHR